MNRTRTELSCNRMAAPDFWWVATTSTSGSPGWEATAKLTPSTGSKTTATNVRKAALAGRRSTSPDTKMSERTTKTRTNLEDILLLLAAHRPARPHAEQAHCGKNQEGGPDVEMEQIEVRAPEAPYNVKATESDDIDDHHGEESRQGSHSPPPPGHRKGQHCHDEQGFQLQRQTTLGDPHGELRVDDCAIDGCRAIEEAKHPARQERVAVTPSGVPGKVIGHEQGRSAERSHQ